MILSNVEIIAKGLNDILISGNKISLISEKKINANTSLKISFENAIAFPGLINSHDHLDFNNYPQLGNKTYTDYTDWAANIHTAFKETIEYVKKIPLALRISWGVYKNLLNGVTTVINHGNKLKINYSPIDVFQNCYSLHSVKFEENWKKSLINPFSKKIPFVMHAGEGVSDAASNEINEIIKWNFFNRKLIGVHGIAMNEQQAKNFCALVWCPVSNLFLFNRTANISVLKNYTKIIFGTDSTLTANWNIWQHLREAQKQNMLSDKELFDSITVNPALVWKLNEYGRLEKDFIADIVIAKKKSGDENLKSFFNVDPEDILVVIKNGEIKLADESLAHYIIQRKFSKIFVGNACKYVEGNLQQVVETFENNYQDIKLPITV